MISEYLDKETVVAQLQKELPYEDIDWDLSLSQGQRLGNYIAYPAFAEGMKVWLLTHYLVGTVEAVVFSENLEDGYLKGLVTK